jgi:diadenosine tetraphosphate (Ap4A) HIT family hydrolase
MHIFKMALTICFLSCSYFTELNAQNEKNITTCAFCKPNVFERQLVYDGKYMCVLVDHAPRVNGHLLIVPKRHVQKYHELTTEEGNEVLPLLQKCIQVFKKLIGTDDYIILEKNGRSAWQSVPHVHFHLTPIHRGYFKKDDYEPLLISLFNRKKPMTDKELQDTVAMFREAFQSCEKTDQD